MPIRRRVFAGLMATVLAACARQGPPAAPPPAPMVKALPGLTVLLTWNAPVDLDLYLTDPTSETVYFANTPSRTGARLIRDSRCGQDDPLPFVEVANLPEPLPGRYRVGVDFIDACAAREDQPVTFRVVVSLGAAQRQATGTIRLAQFQPIVLEFELQQASSHGVPVLSEDEAR